MTDELEKFIENRNAADAYAAAAAAADKMKLKILTYGMKLLTERSEG